MLDNYYDEYVAHVTDKKCPSGQCKSLLEYFVNAENCVGCYSLRKSLPSGCNYRGQKRSSQHKFIDLHQVWCMYGEM